MQSITPGNQQCMQSITPGNQQCMQSITPGNQQCMQSITPGNQQCMQGITPGNQQCMQAIVQELCESHSRWTSWAVRPNDPSGFRGRKDLLHRASALVTTCP